MIEIRIIDKAHSTDLNLPNEPFPLFGRLIPSYTNETWSCTEELFPEAAEMTFPDEAYDYDEMAKTCTVVGAYDGDTCVGLGIFQNAMFRYWYLYDLKISAAYRGQGVAAAIVDRAVELALEKGLLGIYTIGQDNNLAACRFYLKNGFAIGGFDNRVYEGTGQQGKADIYFYRRG